ncbi:hypothetical protein [Butyrivibrio sp. XPD2006]|uniref:hypothetical protein n=1 Tax=Butyrivibrio sp. XPD2006 TaxID=1280668 RepID=UPI0003B5F939|nr:hypothetical protein [Butyrivibrio sp. XPD2006]
MNNENPSELKLLTPTEKSIEELPEFSYEGYQVVRGEFFAHLFEPSVTLKDEKVSVNMACIRRLPNAEYVQFLVNPTEKKLAVKPCSEDMKDSFRWSSTSDDGKRKPRSISCKIFFAKVMKLMDWNPEYRYKVLGKLVHAGADYLFVFDLTCAETYLSKKDSNGIAKRTAYYPEEWKNQFGVPVSEHKDTIQINIFDDYAVFKIEREETNEDARNDSSSINSDRHEKNENSDPQEHP